MRLLGIDYGARRVGVALGDTETRIASPWTVITYDDRLELLKRLHEIAEREGAKAFVVGIPRLPTDMQRETKQTEEIRGFIADLAAQGLEVFEVDETMTTQLAARQAAEAGERGKRDDLAAAALLQTWLDKNGSS